jgi:hypothetical protein
MPLEYYHRNRDLFNDLLQVLVGYSLITCTKKSPLIHYLNSVPFQCFNIIHRFKTKTSRGI